MSVFVGPFRLDPETRRLMQEDADELWRSRCITNGDVEALSKFHESRFNAREKP